VRPYADTNLFVRFHLPLPLRTDALSLTNDAGKNDVGRPPVTWLLEIELTNAIEHNVFMSRTSGQFRVTPEAAGAAHALFAEDLGQGDFLTAAALDADALKHAAKELALRHTARRGFRTYDLLHVSSALLLGCDTFWSFDLKARALAEAEGLTLNPLSASPAP